MNKRFDDLIWIQKAADILNVSKTTLRSWHKKGKLVPAYVHPLTKMRFYNKGDVIKFLADSLREQQDNPEETNQGL